MMTLQYYCSFALSDLKNSRLSFFLLANYGSSCRIGGCFIFFPSPTHVPTGAAAASERVPDVEVRRRRALLLLAYTYVP